MGGVTLLALAAACADGGWPTTSASPLSVPPSARFYEDSSAIACAQWNCRSLESWEHDELSDGLYRGLYGALQTGDLDCYNLYNKGIQSLSANKVYVARQKPPEAPDGTLGGYNRSTPNETYIMQTRWSSASEAVNTMNHESGHAMNARPSTRGIDSWEQQMQEGANACQWYTEQ